MPGVATLHLDGDLLAANDADAQVNVAETAAADLADDAIFAANDELIARRTEHVHHGRGHIVVGRRRVEIGGGSWMAARRHRLQL